MNFSLSDISKLMSQIVKDVSRSVVTIYTEIPSYDLFLGYRVIRGVGSGFVIEKGYVVTNAHVVRDSSNVMVVYSDGTKLRGSIVAVDPYRDLALVYTGRVDIEPLVLGDSDSLSIGELVFAIGSPLGLAGPSVTMGIVSAVGRTIVDEKSGIVLEDLIQTDAAINPGNSGGPLVNSEGRAIGIATAIIPYAQGIGFAIPINTVKKFIDQIRRYGKPIRAWIGVYVTPITRELASMYSLPVEEGLLIVKVLPGSPAHEAGIRAGDIIVKAHGKTVKKPRDLSEAVEESIDKGCVDIEILRDRHRYRGCIPIIVEEIG
ncbi:MAG TPA: trypsin-like serine protease [Ignisphaera sp.]|nr:trypsin-like serine protease [Ignisphaera sp.]